MMKSTIRVLCLGCLSLWLVGCASKSRVDGDSKALPAHSVPSPAASQARISNDKTVAKIKCGVTTEEQLLAWFGPASSQRSGSAGGKTLTWKSDNLMAMLDANGKVIGVVVSEVLTH